MRAGTRLTGWATLLVGYATVLLAVLPYGVVPYGELPPKRHLLWMLGATGFCALCWILASLLVRARRRAALRRKALRKRHQPWPEPRRSRALSWVLGLGIALTSAAALNQAVGPDGTEGRWLAELNRAGGRTHQLTVSKVVGGTQTPGAAGRDVEEFSSTIVVTVPFDSGPRQMTVGGVRTEGELEQGRSIELLYAPSRPDLGVRPAADDLSSTVGRIVVRPVIWLLALVAGLSTAVAMHRREAGVARARRFEPWVHLPAAAVLAGGAALSVPLLTGFPDTTTGWGLAAGAAAGPWLALAWVVRTS
ncbi:hypothetical protein [Streptomyces sp. I05A-00742]|uniref:hypothetical protein n=1 Tax=Streptomyces sp. I05A-00742 TaxID=2732853 RepID=UPI0014883C48|nr:hypothetical protein [Streptomyces sp. I05A-00742]